MSSKLIIIALLAFSLALADKPKKKPKTVLQPIPAAQQDPVPDAAVRRAADYLACLHAQARFVEAMSARRGQCEAAAQQVRDCIGRVRNRQSSNTGKGAIIGIGAAILTGGTTLLYTGAGALIGHQTSDEAPNECGTVPKCDSATIEVQLSSEGVRQRACAQ